MAKLIKETKAKSSKLAVHCLAGIGRTSTMIIAAHMKLGENLDQLKKTIGTQNPTYKLTGSQAEFIEAVNNERGLKPSDL